MPLGGKPLIAHALAEASRAGFESAIVVVSPAKQALVRFLDATSHPIPVETILQPEPLGIGDAVLRCWQGETVGTLLPDDVVLETEHWTDLLEVHRRTGAAALCLRPVAPQMTSRFGIAECKGEVVERLFEKPAAGTTASNLAIFGRYIVTEPVVSGLRDVTQAAEVELTYGFASALKEPPGVRAVSFSGQIFDCGTPTEYAASLDRFSRLAIDLAT